MKISAPKSDKLIVKAFYEDNPAHIPTNFGRVLVGKYVSFNENQAFFRPKNVDL